MPTSTTTPVPAGYVRTADLLDTIREYTTDAKWCEEAENIVNNYFPSLNVTDYIRTDEDDSYHEDVGDPTCRVQLVSGPEFLPKAELAAALHRADRTYFTARHPAGSVTRLVRKLRDQFDIPESNRTPANHPSLSQEVGHSRTHTVTFTVPATDESIRLSYGTTRPRPAEIERYARTLVAAGYGEAVVTTDYSVHPQNAPTGGTQK